MEIDLLRNDLRNTLGNLSEWMKPEMVSESVNVHANIVFI